jgi:hypothetical protein
MNITGWTPSGASGYVYGKQTAVCAAIRSVFVDDMDLSWRMQLGSRLANKLWGFDNPVFNHPVCRLIEDMRQLEERALAEIGR